jgi:hypothetical protein
MPANAGQEQRTRGSGHPAAAVIELITAQPCRVPKAVPPENRIPALTLGFLRFSGGSLVFVDQAAEDRFSADLARH